MEDSLAPKPPFRALVCGASGCGKTVEVGSLLLDHYPPDKVHRIVWVAPAYSLSQPVVDALEGAYPVFKKIDGSDGWTHTVREEIEKALNKGRSRGKDGFYPNDCMLVVDDMLAAGKRDKFVANLYTTARHLGVSILELAQRVFAGDSSARTQRLNCTHFWLFGFPGGPAEVKHLLQQTEDKENAKTLYEEYRRIVANDKHGFLFLDLTAPEGDKKRYRESSLDNFIEL